MLLWKYRLLYIMNVNPLPEQTPHREVVHIKVDISLEKLFFFIC
jgi:hypothetical protein